MNDCVCVCVCVRARVCVLVLNNCKYLNIFKQFYFQCFLEKLRLQTKEQERQTLGKIVYLSGESLGLGKHFKKKFNCKQKKKKKMVNPTSRFYRNSNKSLRWSESSASNKWRSDLTEYFQSVTSKIGNGIKNTQKPKQKGAQYLCLWAKTKHGLVNINVVHCHSLVWLNDILTIVDFLMPNPGSGRVDTALWMHHLDANKTVGEEARRQLHKNVASNIE